MSPRWHVREAQKARVCLARVRVSDEYDSGYWLGMAHAHEHALIMQPRRKPITAKKRKKVAA